MVDTGGFDPSSEESLIEGVRRQVLAAVEESDLVLFVVDTRAGVTALDEELARTLRRCRRPVVLVANKVDGGGMESALAELYRLGFGDPLPVSSEHGRGVAEMLEIVRARVPAEPSTPSPRAVPVHIAVIGRPNVGKSSLVNAVVGGDRVLVDAAPGTTRDAVDTAFVYEGRPYVLVDTAGIRRKGRVTEVLEKLAVVMARKSLERCQVALLVLDASEGVAAQDAHLAGYADEAGRATVLVVNKWDLVPAGMVRKAEVVEQIRDRLPVSRLRSDLFHLGRARQGGGRSLRDDRHGRGRGGPPTSRVQRSWRRCVRPSSGAQCRWRVRPLTLQSASQIAVRPPSFALRVSRPSGIHFSYERYLVKSLRRAFGLTGSPIRLSFRQVLQPVLGFGPRSAEGRRQFPTLT